MREANTSEIVVWLAREPDGSEGIMAMFDPYSGMMMPLFATRGGRSEGAVDRRAAIVAAASGRHCRKVLFRRAEVLETRGGPD